MSKRKFTMKCKRALAVLLAFVMTLTTFVDGAFVSKASTSTLPYTGEIRNGNELFIEAWQFAENNMTFDDATIMAVLNSQTQEFDSIYIQYPDKNTTSVSADLWNAAVNKLSASEDRYVQYAFTDSNSYNMDWSFQQPTTTDSAVTMKANVGFGSSMTVNFDNTSFPSHSAHLNLNTDSQTADYTSFTNIFGIQTMNLEYVDPNGNTVDVDARYDVGSWTNDNGDGTQVVVNSSHVQFGKINELSAGITYTLQKENYRGRVDSNPEGTWTCLAIDAMEAGKRDTGFTAQEILDTMNYHAGETFNEISIIQPYTCDVIYKDVVNAAPAYLKEDSNKTIVWYYNDWSGKYPQERWILDNPGTMTADKTVAFTLGFNSDGTPYVNIGSTDGLTADNISLEYMVSIGTTEATALQTVLGSSWMDITAGNSGVSGWYNVDEWNVFVRLDGVTGLTPGVDYILKEKPYIGNVDSWMDGDGYQRTVLHIDAMDAGKSGTGFTAQDIIDILAYYDTESFDEIRIKQPESKNVIYKAVMDAITPYLKDMNNRVVNWVFADFPGNTSFGWEMHTPLSITADQTVSTVVDIDSDGKPYVQIGDSSNLTSSQINFQYEGNRNLSTEAAALVAALGSQEMDISAGDSGVDGYYNGNDEWVWFNLRNIKQMDPAKSYTIGKRVYNGDVFVEGDGRKFFEINYNRLISSGETFDEDALLKILKKQTDKDFVRVYIYAPADYTSFSADVWNAALNLLSETAAADQWHAIQLGTDGEYTTQWTFNWPYEDDQPIDVDVNTVWSTDRSGMQFSLSNAQYPALNTNVTFNTVSDMPSLSIFENAFGMDDMRLEIVDADGNVQRYSDGYYNSYSWDDGYNRNVEINSIQNLTADETYTLQQKTYRGDENSYNGSTSLNIRYDGFDDTGVDCSDDAIIDILKDRAESGTKYNNVSIVLPEAQDISAEMWNAAVAVLKPGDEVEGFEGLSLEIRFTPDDTCNTYWTFIRPWTMEEDTVLSLGQQFVFQDDCVEVNFNTTQGNAEATRVGFQTYSDRSDFQSFIDVFGEGEGNPEIIDADGNTVTGFYAGTFMWNGAQNGFTIDIMDVEELTAGETYRLIPYRGDVETWEDEEGNVHQNLIINAWGAGKNGEPFTEDELLAILQANEGRTFKEIYLTQVYNSDPAEDNLIWASVVNEAVKLLDQEGWNHLDYGFNDDDSNYGYSWAFENVRGLSSDFEAIFYVDLDGSFTIESDYSGVDADHINLHYHASRESMVGSSLLSKFGEGEVNLIVEDTDKYGWYQAQEEDVCLDVYDIDGLALETSYSLARDVYKGDEHHDGDYDFLDINAYRFYDHGEEFSEATVLAILEEKAANSFDSIAIRYPSKASLKVSMEIWNAARALLKEDREETDINIYFDDGETYDLRWSFINPEEVTSDVAMNANVTFSTNGTGVSLKFGKVSYPATRVDFGINTDNNRTYESKFVNALGSASMDVDIALSGKPTGIRGRYDVWVDEENEYASYDLCIWDISSLTKDKTYKTQKYLYTGDVDIWTDDMGNETSYLHIFPQRAGYGDQLIPVEEIIAILGRNKGKTYDQIYIEQPETENNIIYAEVVNEAIKYLKEEGEQILKFAYFDYHTGTKNEIWMQYPSEMTEDQEHANAYVSINDNGVPFVNKGDLSKLNTMIVSLWHETFVPEDISALQEYFVANRSVSVDGTEADGWVEFNEEHAVIHLNGIYPALEDNRDYTISAKKYTGEEIVWDDGTTILHFDEYGFNDTLAEFTEAAVAQILQDRVNAGEEFDKILINYPVSNDNTVSKDVWNAAAALLKEYDPALDDPNVNDMPALTVCFLREEGYATCWILGAPEPVEEDVVLGEEFSVGDKVEMQLANTNFPATRVVLNIESIGGENPFVEILGSETMQIELAAQGQLAEQDVHGEYYIGEEDWYDQNYWFLQIYDVQNLDAGTAYTVSEYVYRGDVGYTEDGDIYSLHISADAFGKTKLTAADLEGMVAYYTEKSITFNEITVEQKYASSNVISKDIINTLRAILKDDGEMRFTFCRCEEGEDGGNYLSDMIWVLTAPDEATKDINANITLTTPANQGLKVQFNANTYNAESVRAGFVAGHDTKFAQDMMLSVEGAGNTLEASTYDDYLLAIKKGTEVDLYKGIHYERYDEIGMVALTIHDVEDFAAKTSYTLSQVNYYFEEIFEVGQSYDWTAYLSNEPSGKVTWKCLTANTAEVTSAGLVTMVNEGIFVITATYKFDGKTHTELWLAGSEIVLRNIAFTETSKTVDQDAEAVHYLEIQTYPANVSTEDLELVWSVSGNDIITLTDDGGFIANNVGTATITATVSGSDISAECEVTVVEPIIYPSDEQIEQLEGIFAVTNFDTTLADIEHQLPDGFAWKDSSIKLSNYAGMTSATFWAVYTDPNGRTLEGPVPVTFMTIKGISLKPLDENFDFGAPYVQVGNSVEFSYEWDVVGNLEKIKTHEAFKELVFNVTGMGAPVNSNDPVFLFDAASAGKKTVKLTVMYGKKTIASTSAVIQVTKGQVLDFNGYGITYSYSDDGDGDVKTGQLELVFANPDNYYKPTIQSSDTSVLKIGKVVYPSAADIKTAQDNGTAISMTIPYTEVKPGQVTMTIKLADEVKSSLVLTHTVVDKEPKVLETSFTINTAYDFKYVPITIQFANGYAPSGDVKVINDTKGFILGYADQSYDSENGRLYALLQLPVNTTLKSGTHTVTIAGMVDNNPEDALNGVSFELKVKVKVISTKPSITVKQPQKVNTFYNQVSGSDAYLAEGYGVLTIDGKTDYVEIVQPTDSDNLLTNTDDFKMYYNRDVGAYVIYYKPNDDKTIDKKATITYNLYNPAYGWIYGLTKDITISTVNKAPALGMSLKSETLYPGYDYTDFRVWDKNTGYYLNLDNVSLVKSAKEVIKITENAQELQVGKNTYLIYLNEGYSINMDLLTRNQAADKLKFRIQEDNWTKPVDVTYTVNVKTAAPKLKLGSSKLTLNINEDVYQNEIAYTWVELTGYTYLPDFADVKFTGNNAKSKEVLNEEIDLFYEDGYINAKFNFDPSTPVKERPSGSYSFKVWVDTGYFQTSTNITVNVVNKTVAQSIKLTKSGSIDVLNRDMSYLTYTPKLTNLTGIIDSVSVIGPDADKFTAYYVDGGKIFVFANEGVELSTAATYKIAFQIEMLNWSKGGSAYDYTYETPVQSFKVTQGKPKVTITSGEGTTLYGQAGNSLTADISAVLKNEDILIENVTLANYTGDLDLDYDPDYQTITLSRLVDEEGKVIIDQINKTGKTWSLKLNVNFKDQAGNVKDTQVTYKIKVQ